MDRAALGSTSLWQRLLKLVLTEHYQQRRRLTMC